MRRRAFRLVARVDEGARLTDALRSERMFPEVLPAFADAGESSGALSRYLVDAAGYFDTRSRFTAMLATRSLVPFVILLNAVLVLGFMAAIFLPIREVLESTIR